MNGVETSLKLHKDEPNPTHRYMVCLSLRHGSRSHLLLNLCDRTKMLENWEYQVMTHTVRALGHAWGWDFGAPDLAGSPGGCRILDPGAGFPEDTMLFASLGCHDSLLRKNL